MQYSDRRKQYFPSMFYAARHLSVMLSESGELQQADKERFIQASNSHQINSIFELRRVERLFAYIGTPDVTQPMTAACRYWGLFA